MPARRYSSCQPWQTTRTSATSRQAMQHQQHQAARQSPAQLLTASPASTAHPASAWRVHPVSPFGASSNTPPTSHRPSPSAEPATKSILSSWPSPAETHHVGTKARSINGCCHEQKQVVDASAAISECAGPTALSAVCFCFCWSRPACYPLCSHVPIVSAASHIQPAPGLHQLH